MLPGSEARVRVKEREQIVTVKQKSMMPTNASALENAGTTVLPRTRL